MIERSLVPGRFVVVPGSGASAPLARLTRGVAAGGFQRQRDVRLFVLASWTGVLWQRLSRSERRSAARRLKSMLAAPAARDSEFAPIPPMAFAIGQVAYREEMDFLRDIMGDVLSGDAVSVDHISGAESGGGFDASGGSDGGH